MGTDDDIRHGGGPLKYWLTYKITELGVRGWHIVGSLLLALVVAVWV